MYLKVGMKTPKNVHAFKHITKSIFKSSFYFPVIREKGFKGV